MHWHQTLKCTLPPFPSNRPQRFGLCISILPLLKLKLPHLFRCNGILAYFLCGWDCPLTYFLWRKIQTWNQSSGWHLRQIFSSYGARKLVIIKSSFPWISVMAEKLFLTILVLCYLPRLVKRTSSLRVGRLNCCLWSLTSTIISSSTSASV